MVVGWYGRHRAVPPATGRLAEGDGPFVDALFVFNCAVFDDTGTTAGGVVGASVDYADDFTTRQLTHCVVGAHIQSSDVCPSSFQDTF